MKTKTVLPSAVEEQLRRIGRGIRTARMRRRMTQEELAARIDASWHTVRKMEHGAAGTGIGVYLKALWVMGLWEDVGLLADPQRDREGLVLEAARLGKLVRPKREMNRDF